MNEGLLLHFCPVFVAYKESATGLAFLTTSF